MVTYFWFLNVQTILNYFRINPIWQFTNKPSRAITIYCVNNVIDRQESINNYLRINGSKNISAVPECSEN